MKWNKHSNVEGRHAFLSPSKSTWLNDTEEDLIKRMCAAYAAQVGTLLHAKAAEFITYKSRMTRNEKRSVFIYLLANGIPRIVADNLNFDDMFNNLCSYVNDAVSFRMDPEIPLYFSEECFGTADAIMHDEKTNMLRIHDLKTGVTPAKMEQLYIYTALFFLEYSYVKMSETNIELRIYKNNEIIIENPGVDIILPIMEKIKKNSNFVALQK